MDKILAFFEFDKPCPPEIVNCENVRQQYHTEAEDLKTKPGCWGCKEKSLKNKYINLLSTMIRQ
jgi:hypothetical protein